MRIIRLCGLFSAVAFILTAMMFAAPAYPTGALAARSATPTGATTIDPAALDITNATVYRSKDGILEISLPRRWIAGKSGSNGINLYSLAYTQPGAKVGIAMVIIIGRTSAVYSGAFRASASVDTPEAALEAYKEQAPGNVTVGDIEPASAGDYTGSKVTIKSSATQSSPPLTGEIWVLALPDDHASVLIMASDPPWWEQGAKDVLYKMVDTMKVNLTGESSSEATPTAEPTNGGPIPTKTQAAQPGGGITPIPLLPGQ